MWSPHLNKFVRHSSVLLYAALSGLAFAQQPPVEPPPVPEEAAVRPAPRSYPSRAVAEFGRAVTLARSGDPTEA